MTTRVANNKYATPNTASPHPKQNLIQKVLSDFDLAKTDFNFPEITQCQLIKSSLKSIPLESLIIDVKTFSEITQASEELRLDLDGLDDYRNDLEKAIASNDRQLCTQLGQDWLRKMDRLFLSARQMVASYEMKLIELNGEAYLIKQKKIAKDIETLNSTVSDYKNLKTMLNYAAFESSEVEKRAKGMHKYLFAKPDSIVSECVGRAEENKCGPLEGLSGVVKAMYQKYRNQGPIYELLLNNEKYFNDSMMKLGKTMISIIQFENQFLPPQMKKMLEGAYSSKLIQFMEVRDKNAFAMDHLTPSFLVKGTASYAQICSQAKIVVNEYLKATNHMMSSYGMCQMIKNVLHEPEVSKSLKNYCLPSSPSQDSKLNNLRYRLAGRYATSVEKTVTSGQLFSRSPKAFVDQLLIRMDELGCYAD